MKVAFCFSGQIRELNKSVDYWKKLVDKYQADVYGSFWDTSVSGNPHSIDSSVDLPEEDKKLFLNTFSPKKVEFENFNSFRNTIKIFNQEISIPIWVEAKNSYERNVNLGLGQEIVDYIMEGNLFSMWYKVWRANLLSNQEKYDIVVRARTDVFMDETMEIEENEYLNLPNGWRHNIHWLDCGGPIDCFAYGRPEVMDFYSSVIFYLSRYLKDGDYLFPAENILSSHLSRKEISVRGMGIDLFFYRDPEKSFNFGSSFVEDVFNTKIKYHNRSKDPNFTFYKHP
jgi:hypothetical protein